MNRRHRIRTVIKDLKTKNLGKHQFETRETSNLPTQFASFERSKKWREGKNCWLLVVQISKNGNSMRKNIQKEIPNIIKKNAFPNRDVSVKLLILLEEKAMEVQKLIRKTETFWKW